MIRGTLYVTTDLNMLKNLIGMSRVIIIGEPDPGLVNSIQAVVGSILMPPYSAMTHYVNGDMNTFGMEYINHLMKQEATEFIAVMIKALCNGTNLTVYVTPDEYDMYFRIFAEYMINIYGIVIGNERMPFSFNPTFIPSLCNLLFLSNLMTVEELFMNYPVGVQFSELAVIKLINEVSPRIKNTDFNSYAAYFMQYNQMTKTNGRYIAPALVTNRRVE